VAIPVAILGTLWQAVDDRDQHGGGCTNLQAVKAAEAQKLKKSGVESPHPVSE
jgi:hypothetical protein